VKRWELAALGVVLLVGVWLRFSRLDLLEFKGDEAMALHLASKLAHGSGPVLAGLMSSVKVTNPPLFIYLLAPLVWISHEPVFISCCIAALNLVAVMLCWQVGRKYFGCVAGLVAAALFAVSPWAVIYSRKIWAQDLVPVFVAGTLWAYLALVFEGRRKAIFWVVLLPLLVIQIHFSGLALTVVVVLLLLLLRPALDWRLALAAVAVAAVLGLPYVWYQTRNDWSDFRQAKATLAGQSYRIPEGMVVHPDLGYAFPRRDSWWHVVALVAAGEIEDILGLSARAELDPNGVWRTAHQGGAEYFEATQWLGNWLLWVEGVAFVVAWGWLAVRAWRVVRFRRQKPWVSVAGTAAGKSAWVLVLWVAVPLVVFVAARLWTYLSYFVILFPVVFLVLGVAVQELLARVKWAGWVVPVLMAVLVGNVVFVEDLYRFLGRYGGAHGTYGTVLAHKQAAAEWLADRMDVGAALRSQRIWQMDRPGKLERARLDVVWLASQRPATVAPARFAEATVVVFDRNRMNLSPRELEEWQAAVCGRALDQAVFGPLQLVLLAPRQE
jgi:hypothetical protein